MKEDIQNICLNVETVSVEDILDTFNIKSAFEIDEKINELQDILPDNYDELNECRNKIKLVLYNVENWDIEDLENLFELTEKDTATIESFNTKISPHISNENQPLDERTFKQQAIIKLGNALFPNQYSIDNVEFIQTRITDQVKYIEIDSDFRKSMSEEPYDFLFECAPSSYVKNVEEIELHYAQIPLDWYTISEEFGNHFFYYRISDISNVEDIRYVRYDSRANAGGEIISCDEIVYVIDYNDFTKIKVPDGNYSSQELIDTINKKMKESTGISVSGEEWFTYDNTNSLKKCTIHNRSDKTIQFIFYDITSANWTNVHVQNCLGMIIGALTKSSRLCKPIPHILTIEGDNEVLLPGKVNTCGTKHINIILDHMSSSQIYTSVVGGMTEEFNLLHGRRMFDGTNVFARIPLTETPASDDIRNSETTKILTLFNNTLKYKRYLNQTTISKIRVRVTNEFYQPLYGLGNISISLIAKCKVQELG